MTVAQRLTPYDDVCSHVCLPGSSARPDQRQMLSKPGGRMYVRCVKLPYTVLPSTACAAASAPLAMADHEQLELMSVVQFGRTVTTVKAEGSSVSLPYEQRSKVTA